MLSLPIHPRLARLLVAARECGRGREGAAIAALLSERDIRVRDSSAASGRSPTVARAIGRSDVLDRLDMLALAERHAIFSFLAHRAASIPAPPARLPWCATT